MAINDEELIEACYRALLLREPEQSGFEGHLLRLRGGQPVENTLRAFISSPEFQLKSALSAYEALGVSGLLVKSDFEGLEFLYPVYDRVQLPQLLKGKPFQIEELQAAFEFVQGKGFALEGGTFLDIGANVGSSVISALMLQPFDNGFAIEAAPDNVRYLRANLALSDMLDRVTVAPVGISDHSGSSYLWKNLDNCGDYRLEKAGASSTPKDALAGRESIPVSSLDDLARVHSIDATDVSFIWIDCQGSEGLIFDGGAQFFDEVRAPIFTEFWPYGLDRLGCSEAYFRFVEHDEVEAYIFKEGAFVSKDSGALRRYFKENLDSRAHTDLLLMPR